MGKGEFQYHRDWAENDDTSEAQPPYKQMILALIADEVSSQVASQVAAKVDAALKQLDGKVSSYITNIEGKTDGFMKEHAASSAASQERAVLLARIEGLEQTVKRLQAKPQVVQTPQGKIVMQQPIVAKPSAYTVNVVRGADHLIKTLDLIPK